MVGSISIAGLLAENDIKLSFNKSMFRKSFFYHKNLIYLKDAFEKNPLNGTIIPRKM